MTNRRGRPCLFKDGSVSEPVYIESHPKELLNLLSKGLLDCQIYAAFSVSKDTFYRWLHEHKEFKHAYDIGLPKCEAVWVQKMQERFEQGDDKGFKYCISLMNNKFGWGKEESKSVVHQNISISNMNVLQHKSKTDLLDYIKSTAEKHSDILDVQFIESKSNQSE